MRKEKIGIVTVVNSTLLLNYGSIFQHYALRQAIKRLGYTPIRLQNPPTGVVMGCWQWYKARAKRRVCSALWRLSGKRKIEASRRARMILALSRSILRFYRATVGRFFEPERDVSIRLVGSDQVWTVWTPRVACSDVTGPCRRIAYAASADWECCRRSEAWGQTAQANLSRFDAISVREAVGVRLLSELLPEKKIFHAIDPVMLLRREEYLSLCDENPIFSAPTLFVYLLNVRNGSEFDLAAYEALAERLGCQLKILGAQGAERFVPERYAVLPSPEDLLRMYRDATYVITNSFHGTVFALLFERPFLSVHQVNLPGTNQNIRQEELLAHFSLQRRIIPVDCLGDSKEVLVSDVDWQDLRNHIADWRKVSLDWLRQALLGSGQTGTASE